MAAGPTNGNFGGEGDAWDSDGGETYAHYTNINNPDLRMDWTKHHFAIPSEAGYKADGNAAIRGHGDQTLVDVPTQ